MADSQLGWSAAQWEKVNNAVTEAFTKASVASAFLPCYGPLANSAEYVRDETIVVAPALVTIQDDTTLQLFNLTVDVTLSSEQVADDALSSALVAFRRAANTLAGVEDDIVFNGFGASRAIAQAALTGSGLPLGAAVVTPPGVVRRSPPSLRGLVHTASASGPGTASQVVASAARAKTGRTTPGNYLVTAIARAIVELESASHPGPFACVLGSEAFVQAYTPAAGLVLPADRITPMLNGPLLRSGRIAPNVGIVVSLAAGAIDIVVATPPTAQFLLVDQTARYLFRTYEKFILRIKDATAVHGVSI